MILPESSTLRTWKSGKEPNRGQRESKMAGQNRHSLNQKFNSQTSIIKITDPFQASKTKDQVQEKERVKDKKGQITQIITKTISLLLSTSPPNKKYGMPSPTKISIKREANKKRNPLNLEQNPKEGAVQILSKTKTMTHEKRNRKRESRTHVKK